MSAPDAPATGTESADWDTMFARLVHYMHQNGNCLVFREPPDPKEDPEEDDERDNDDDERDNDDDDDDEGSWSHKKRHNELAQWVQDQWKSRGKDLTDSQRYKLDLIHFFEDWDYHRQQGKGDADSRKRSTSKKRSQSRSGSITTARSSPDPTQPYQLELYQSDIKTIAQQWKKHNKKDPHAKIHPDEYPLEFSLASMIYDRLQNHIDAIKVRHANFDQREARWNINYEKLRAHRATFGHCQVLVRRNTGEKPLPGATSPSSAYFDKSLAGWVRNQHHRREALTPERDDRLDKLGFWVSLEEGKRLRAWSNMLARLEDHVGATGVKMPSDDRELALWIQEQQRGCDELSSFQQRKLTDLGIPLGKKAAEAAASAFDQQITSSDIWKSSDGGSRAGDISELAEAKPASLVNTKNSTTIILRTPTRRPVETRSPVYHYASIQDLTPRKKHCRRKLASSVTESKQQHPANDMKNEDREDSEELRSFAAACYQRLITLGKIPAKS